MLQGFGLGLMFVPLNTVALSTIPPALRTQGTAMWTLIRNLGSSIGVSIVIANLTNSTIADARAAGGERDALQSGAGRPRRGHARSRRPRWGARCSSS